MVQGLRLRHAQQPVLLCSMAGKRELLRALALSREEVSMEVELELTQVLVTLLASLSWLLTSIVQQSNQKFRTRTCRFSYLWELHLHFYPLFSFHFFLFLEEHPFASEATFP